MIGNEQSLIEGHNIQIADRIIRVESVWGPGNLEQAESRIHRPDPLGKHAKREFVFLDWLIVDHTVDVTKMSRLISKIISAARFYEAKNPQYDNLFIQAGKLPPITSGRKFLQAKPSIEDDLIHYGKTYSALLSLQAKEYKDFALAQGSDYVDKKIPAAPMPKGCGIIDVPYVPMGGPPLAQKFGLMAISDYAVFKKVRASEVDLDGLRVHTEFGDGVVVRNSKGAVPVLLDSGVRKPIPRSLLYVMTKKLAKSYKASLADELALKYKPSKVVKVVEEEDVAEDDDTGPTGSSVTLSVGATDGFACLMIEPDEDAELDTASLEELGFVYSGNVLCTHVRNYKTMDLLVELLNEEFEIPGFYKKYLNQAAAAFSGGGKKRLLQVDQISVPEARTYYMDKRKTVPKGELHPYITIDNDELYVMIDMDKQVAAKRVKTKIVGTGIRWYTMDYWIYLTRNKRDLISTVKRMRKEYGFTVENIEEVQQEYSDLKYIPRKDEVEVKPAKVVKPAAKPAKVVKKEVKPVGKKVVKPAAKPAKVVKKVVKPAAKKPPIKVLKTTKRK